MSYLFWAAASIATLAAAGTGERELVDVAAAVTSIQRRIDVMMFDSYMTSRAGVSPARVDRFIEAVGTHARFIDAIHLASRTSPPWLDWNRKREWTTPEGRLLFHVFERNAVLYKLDAEKPFPTTVYTDAIGWRPPREPMPEHLVKGRRFFLLDVFAADNLANLVLRPGRDVVDGLSCLVVEADRGNDLLWLSPDRGYALARRVNKAVGGDGDRASVVEYRFGDFREVEAGIWLPRSCRGSALWRTQDDARRSFHIEVNEVAINRSVPDDVFRPSYTPGTRIYGKGRELKSIVPGGEEALDHWAAVSAINCPATTLDSESQIAPALLLSTGTVLLIFGLHQVMSGRSRGLQPPSPGISTASPAIARGV